MSQTHLGDFENPSDYFFTFTYQLALSWMCPWHIWKLNRGPCMSPSTVSCPCMSTKDSQGLPPPLGPEFTPGSQNLHCSS